MLQQQTEAGEGLSRALTSDLDLEPAEDGEEGDSLRLHAVMLSVIREEGEAVGPPPSHRDAGQPQQKVGVTEILGVKIFNTHYYDLDHSLVWSDNSNGKSFFTDSRRSYRVALTAFSLKALVPVTLFKGDVRSCSFQLALLSLEIKLFSEFCCVLIFSVVASDWTISCSKTSDL